MTEPLLISVNEAGVLLGKCRRSVYGLIAADKLKAVKSGRNTRIVYESLKQYVASLPPAKFKIDAHAKHHLAT